MEKRLRRDFEMICIGGSAGGITALQRIIRKIPSTFKIPVVIVLHLPLDSASLLPEVVAHWTPNLVKQPDDKTPIEGGVIYVAPSGYHLMVEKEKSFCVNLDDPVQFSMPSIDVFFQSASEVYGSKLLGIILSGANEDGAEGLAKIAEAGGLAIVQDPKTAQASFMPEASLVSVPDAFSLSPDEIAEFLSKL